MLPLASYYSSGRLSQLLLWVAALAGVAGLLAARSLVALAPVAGTVAALLNPHLRRDLRHYARNHAARWAAAWVAFLLLSALYTTDWPVWRHEVFRSLPWLGVPLAFTVAVPLSKWQRLAVGSFFVLGTALVGLATLGRYLLHPAAALEAIRIGQNMQAATGVFHVPFGVMLALAFFGGLILRRAPLAGPALRLALVAGSAAAVLTLHLLAYRTGLLVLYAGLLAYVLWLVSRRHLLAGLGILLALALVPWLAYRALPAVRERVAATLWDVEQYTERHDINDYSLARRLAAFETSWQVCKDHWLLGVAPADTHAAMQQQYAWQDFGLRPANRVEVHNQYLRTLMGGGIVGLTLWLGILFGPLLRRAAWRNPALLFFIVIQATVMLVADMLSLQIGLNLFVFGYGFLAVAAERQTVSNEQ